MVEAKQCDDWNHTASLIAWIVKVQVGKKARKLEAKHFHPFAGTRTVKRKLSKDESVARLHQMVGLTDGRNSTHTDDGGGEMEPDGRGDDDDGRGQRERQ